MSDTSNKVKVDQKLVELYERETRKLPTNYRSRRNIVEFNNRFFRQAGLTLPGEQHQDLFAQARQEVHRGDAGYVEMQLLPYSSENREQFEQAQCERCLSIVKDALSRGYGLSDITLLIRSNKQGALLAEFLLKEGLKVISPDSLSINGSARGKGHHIVPGACSANHRIYHCVMISCNLSPVSRA
ncbi:MAG: 3'-5' exonuclease [Owenweeksia sp.]|nr:3'-5' exonuclease [Owenweeksia sp.]